MSGRAGHDQRGFLTQVADAVEQGGYALVITGRALVVALMPRHPGRELGRLMEQLYSQVVKSIPVVVIVGLFMGMILALQTGEELSRFDAENQLGAIVGATLAREMGPFITAIILAATVGAAIAAELGTMRVSEEIDALELMNIDPVRFLVAPRVIALGFAAVLLTILVNVVGILGGALVANAQFGTPVADFIEQARRVFEGNQLVGVLSKDIYSGLVKAYVFGLQIAGLSCAAGLRASGGALGVGRAVRNCVVAAVVMTLIVGYIITWVFWA